MGSREIILNAVDGTRLIEVRHDMRRGLTVSRYRLAMPGKATACEFTTLRKARAAFRAQVAVSRSGLSSGTEDA